MEVTNKKITNFDIVHVLSFLDFHLHSLMKDTEYHHKLFLTHLMNEENETDREKLSQLVNDCVDHQKFNAIIYLVALAYLKTKDYLPVELNEKTIKESLSKEMKKWKYIPR